MEIIYADVRYSKWGMQNVISVVEIFAVFSKVLLNHESDKYG